MQAVSKFIKNKMTLYVFLFNLAYLVFYSTIIFGPRKGEFANIGLIMSSYYFFPVIVFLASFLFATFKEKIIFNFLSLIIIFILLLYDFVLPSFDSEAKLLLLAYIVFPFISASLSHLISKSMQKQHQK